GHTRLQDSSFFDFLLQGGDEVGDGARAEVAFAAVADADSAGFGFLWADDQHVGNFLHLRITDLRGQLFVAVIEMHADTVVFQRFADVFRVVLHLFADWANFHLHGGEPQREGPGVVFDEDAEETLHRTEQSTVHHPRLMASAVIADIFQAEARRQVEVKLHSGELPGAADGVNQFNVDFGTVERGFAHHLLVGNV